MVPVREMLDLVKCKIMFTTDEGDYEGVLTAVHPIAESMTLEKVFYFPGRIFMGGRLYFRCHEISNCVVLDRPGSDDAVENNLASIRCYDNQQDYDRLLLDDDESDVLSVDANLEQDYPEEDYVLKLPPGFHSIPADIVTLDCIGEEFRLAVKHIRSETTIGISLEGPKLGRHGIVSWLGLATSRVTFLFDIQELGKAVFDKGLREIMEDKKIQKIIHDCREVSDCLFHMFDTRLVNVFDTQVADKLVTMQKSRDCKFDKHVNSLNSCLRTYLEVPEDFLYRFNLPQSHYVNIVAFGQRPPKQDLKDVMIKNVIYLRFLKEEMELELLNPFRRAVEVYLNVLQSASNQELLLEPSVPDQFPPELMMQGIQVVRFKNHVDVPLDIASGTSSERLQNPVELLLKLCEKEKSKFSDNLLDKESRLSSNSSHARLSREEPKINISTVKENTLNKRNTRMQQDFCENGATQHRNVAVKSDSSLGNSNSRSTKEIENSVSQYSRPLMDIKNSVSNSTKDVDNSVSDNSLAKLDKLFRSAVSEISFEKEDSTVTQIKESSSDDDALDDPWAGLRAEFSKHSHTNKIEKRRFIPA